MRVTAARWWMVAATFALVLAAAGPAAASDPAAHLAVAPPNIAEVVGVDLEGAQRDAGLGFLRRDAAFATVWGWMERARLGRRVTSALMLTDGIGQSATVLTWGEVEALELQTWEAMLRAAGLAPQEGRRGGPALWESLGASAAEVAPSRPYAVLMLAPGVIAAGDRGVVLQIAEGLARRGRRQPAPILGALEQPAGASIFFAALTPGAAPLTPIATSGRVVMADGALLDLRFTCRTGEEAAAWREEVRAWLGAPARALELEATGLESVVLEHAVVSQVEDRLHVVLTLSAQEVAALLVPLGRADL